MEDIFYPSADGVNTIHACVWQPDGEIKGVVQIIHGMAEYAERYAPFAEFLCKHGYLVCAEDHLGHGKSVKSADDFGYFNAAHDYKTVLADIRSLHVAIKERAGDKPYCVLGHSMGSFFCRSYIAEYGSELSAAVIMGTGFKSKLTLNTALLAVRLDALFKGWRHRSKTIDSLAFGSYNNKFKPLQTDCDWLSANRENVHNYIADPLCGFKFTNNGFFVLFSVIKNACKAKTIKAVPENLPCLFVAGADDPVGDYGKGVIKASEKFKKAGVKCVNRILYDNCRHEILNDDCADDVYNHILDFYNSIL